MKNIHFLTLLLITSFNGFAQTGTIFSSGNGKSPLSGIAQIISDSPTGSEYDTHIFHWASSSTGEGSFSNPSFANGVYPSASVLGNGGLISGVSMGVSDSLISRIYQTGLKVNEDVPELMNPNGGLMFGDVRVTQNQINAGTVLYSGTNHGVYATLSSGDQNGITSLALFANNAQQPAGLNGAITIYQAGDNAFGMFTADTTSAQIGWGRTAGKSMTLSASLIQTGGLLTSSNYFVTQSGLISSDGETDAAILSLAPGTMGLFASRTNDMSNIEIRNWNGGSTGSAGIQLAAGGSYATMAVYPENIGLYGFRSGAFDIQSMADEGILIDALQQGEKVPVIRFAINGKEVGSFGPEGFVPVSMSDENMRAIPNPRPGSMVFDTSNNKIFLYSGKSWKSLKTDDTDN